MESLIERRQADGRRRHGLTGDDAHRRHGWERQSRSLGRPRPARARSRRPERRRRARQERPRPLCPDRPHRSRLCDRGRPRRRSGGSPGGDPGARPTPPWRDVPDQHHVDLQRVRRRRPRGVGRVVWASSETVLGLPFDSPPAFAPIDESHPPRPETSYALSKLVGETLAQQLAEAARHPVPRAADLEHHGAGRLRDVPVLAGRPGAVVAGICGATSMPETWPRQSGWVWKPTSGAPRSASSPPPTPACAWTVRPFYRVSSRR